MRPRRARTLALGFPLIALASVAYAQAPPMPLPAPELFDAGRQLFATDPNRRSQPADPRASRAARDVGAIPVGDWLTYPVMDAGILYDDNLYGSRFDRVSDVALRVRPRLVATHDTGLQTTTIYGLADARFFKENSRGDTIGGTLGGTHRQEIGPDIVVRFQGEYDRRADDYGQALASSAETQAARLPPVQYDQSYLSASVRKDFGAMFAGLGVTSMATRFDAARDNLGRRHDGSSRDETDTRLIGRLGYTLSPALYAFLEPSLGWRDFRSAALDTTGRRLVGGFGSERFSLFSGEVFAGYEANDLRDPSPLPADGPVYGARLSWFPTRDITLTSILERSIGSSVLAPGFGRLNVGSGLEASFGANTLAPLQQTVARTTTAGLQGRYDISRVLSADLAAGYEASRLGDTATRIVSTQAGLNYLLSRNVALRIDYAFAKAGSRETLYTRNRMTVGLSAAW